MTDKSQNEPVNSDWLTPQEAARHIGVNMRYVYRLIERKELVTDGKTHGKLIKRDSAETARLKHLAKSAVDHEIDGQRSNSNDKNSSKSNLALRREAGGQIAQSVILSKNQEYTELEAKYEAVQEAWRADILRLEEERRHEMYQIALELGQFKERVKNLEAQLAAAQVAPQPPPAPAPAQPVEITPKAVEPPQAAQQPQKRGRWAWAQAIFKRGTNNNSGE